MMTVRFPNGQALQYNEALWLDYEHNGTWVLRKAKGGDCVAFIQASAGAIVEFRSPCRVSHPQVKDLQPQIDQLTKEIRSLKRKIQK